MPRTVAELGEFGLVDAVVARLATSAAGDPRVLLGPGDDAAVLSVDDGRLVVSTDVLVEGRHFRRDWSSATDVGHRAAAANLADIAAMGATATALVVAIAVPAELEVDWALGLADGLRDECAEVGARVIGGDVTRGEAVVVSVTALGSLGVGVDPVTRAGARAGDVVALAGRLGWAAAGLAVLSRGFRSPRVLVDAYRRPAVPYAAGPEAARLGAHAMVDVSDGLVADLGHVAAASEVRVELQSAGLEVPDEFDAAARALNVDPLGWLLAGGDDHALAACFPAGTSLPDGWRVLGSVAEPGPDGPGVVVDGRPYETAGGWDHFR
jgi:thiamine-monophosphate kinase